MPPTDTDVDPGHDQPRRRRGGRRDRRGGTTTEATAPSRIRLVDLLGESWLELTRRPVRTILTGLGVALGLAAVVATQGLVSTVRFQVSDEFDAQLATQVEVRPQATAEGGPPSTDTEPATFPPAPDALARVTALSGVEGAAVLRDSQQEVPVTLSPFTDRTRAPRGAVVRGIDAEGLTAVGAHVTGNTWSSWHDTTHQRVALLGWQTATDLGIETVQPGDQVFLDGIGFTILGIITDGGRVSGLTNGVVIPATTSDLFEMSLERDRVLVVTAPGAAANVEAVLPVALDPGDPDRFRAYAPARSADLRRAVDDQLQTLALVLGAVVVGLGLVSIGNATLTSVLQRINEIGIRRAIGARPRHIGLHVVLDAALTGAAGGTIGGVLGLTMTLAVTAHQGWQPVIDPRIVPLAIAAGTLAGALAGLYPARVASRLEPTDALRRE